MNNRLKTNLKRLTKISAIIVIALVISGTMINTALSAAQYDEGDKIMNKIKNSPQYNNGKFENPLPWNDRPSMGMFKEYIFGKQQRTPEVTLPQDPIQMDDLAPKDTSALTVTNVGHSSLIIQMDGYRILTDPVYEAKISPVGPTRFNEEIPIDPTALNDIDVVVISHNHYDHLNKYSIQTIDPEVKHFIVPLGLGAQLEKWGVDRQKITELDWWESYDVDDVLTVTATPSQHFSGRGLTDRNKTLWASYVIATLDHSVYFSGDSGYFEGFKEIGEKYGPFDIAFLECGAYNPAWSFVHMFPEETVQASVDLKAHFVWPIHWGTFNLALHDWFDPMERVSLAAEARGVRLLTPIFGQIISYPDNMVTGPWWKPFMSPADAPLADDGELKPQFAQSVGE